MRTVRLCLLAGLSALTLGLGGGSGGALTRLPWSTAQGLPVLTVGTHDVWIGSIAINAPHTVWRVDPAHATVSPTPIGRSLMDLFPGNGTLWGTDVPLATEGLLLFRVDVEHGYRLVEKNVPSTCDEGDGGHSVVYRERLWLSCENFGAYVFAAGARGPVSRVRVPELAALLPSANGLWAADTTSVRAVAGPAKGAVIHLPTGFVVAGDYASNVGWAVSGTTAWAVGGGLYGRGTLVRIDLRRRVATRFPIVAPVGADGYLGSGLAIAGNELWVGDDAHMRLIRYSRAHPRKPLGFIPLPGRGHAKDAYLDVQGGAGAVWVEAERPGGFQLFRVAIRG